MYIVFRHDTIAHYSVNIAFIRTGKPKNSHNLPYCSGWEPNLQHLQDMPLLGQLDGMGMESGRLQFLNNQTMDDPKGNGKMCSRRK